MPSLKHLRVRINSVKATQKITSAMKMVAASKLRRAQEEAESARPYAERMERMVASVAQTFVGNEMAPKLLGGTGSTKQHLIVVATSDRGLCGGFNGSIIRAVRARIDELEGLGAKVFLFPVGRKGAEQLRRDLGERFLSERDGSGSRSPTYSDSSDIGQTLMEWFDSGKFDVCEVVYNRFQSAMTQTVTFQQLVPFSVENSEEPSLDGAIYEFEPDEEAILEKLLPRNIEVQVFRALLENAASEHGARMMAMDNATRNAGEMIDKLSLTYNRTRQAMITTELIEIVSGAEAL
ncbi:MAG: F0F1 ATP synthase subunit gamma [Rhodospirillaceae bacterium]|nr:F0F1 ATP synthase subunit gamma [Rhodospirillaceae bacterium]